MRSRVSALVRGAVLVSAGAAVALPLIGASVMRPSAQPLAAEVTRQLVTRLAGSGATVWLCRPGMPQDPCTASLATTVVQPSGAQSIVSPKVDATSRFDCFYVYPTVSLEASANADLKVQPAETSVAIGQASRFSTVCRVWAPMYRQVTSAGLQAEPTSTSPSSVIAYDSLRVGFEDYLARYNDGRPIIFIGHSQGATMLTELLEHLVDTNASLRNRLVLAIILGGNVVARTGSLVGGSFTHIPACSKPGETGCVIAYSSFPSEPPAGSLFGRPGQGLLLLPGDKARTGLEVVCVNPASFGGATAALDPLFPSDGYDGRPWVEFPELYSARCESGGGATWLQITKTSGASDPRPVVTEVGGPDWGYHVADVNLALGNLVADVALAEASWSNRQRLN